GAQVRLARAPGTVGPFSFKPVKNPLPARLFKPASPLSRHRRTFSPGGAGSTLGPPPVEAGKGPNGGHPRADAPGLRPFREERVPFQEPHVDGTRVVEHAAYTQLLEPRGHLFRTQVRGEEELDLRAPHRHDLDPRIYQGGVGVRVVTQKARARRD